MSCFGNKVHIFDCFQETEGQPAGLAKMRRRFLRSPRRYLLYGVDGSHFAMYLQILIQGARLPLRRRGDR